MCRSRRLFDGSGGWLADINHDRRMKCFSDKNRLCANWVECNDCCLDSVLFRGRRRCGSSSVITNIAGGRSRLTARLGIAMAFASAVSPLPGGQVGLRFSSPQSEIAIPRRPNDPWGHIRALMIEIKARFAQGAGTIHRRRSQFPHQAQQSTRDRRASRQNLRTRRHPTRRLASLLLQSRRLQQLRLGLRQLGAP